MTRRARILLADDHVLVTEALARLLEARFEVVGTVADGQALLTAAMMLKPDVILVDIAMPMLDGLEAGRRLVEALPACKIIFLTMAQDADLAAEALRIGASGYVLKSAAAWELVQAVEGALRGRKYITPSLDVMHRERCYVRGGIEDQAPTQLTARQRQVLELLGKGQAMKQVAAALGLSIRTVAYHKYEMMAKFRLKSTAELVQFAIRHGVIQS
jgi:DNA-binding NarL/FixJ family response regulator